jgi:histidine triad (HIT) family protein
MHVVPRWEDVPLRRHSGAMADPVVLEERASKIRDALM